MSWMRKMAKDDDVSTKSMRKAKRGEDIDMRKWRKEDVEARRKAKKGNWSIKGVSLGKNKKLGKLESFSIAKSCKGKGGVVLPPHPLKKAKAGNWSKEKPALTKKDIIVRPRAKKPAKRKWYEKPIKTLKGRSK